MKNKEQNSEDVLEKNTGQKFELIDPKIHILLLEDEYNLGETLQEYLLSLNFRCQWAKSIEEAKVYLQKSLGIDLHQNSYSEKNDHKIDDKKDEMDLFHLALLDVNLPDGNGLELGKWIRKHSPETQLLFISAVNDPEVKLESLEIGAQDFITKPFHLKEIVLRIKRIESMLKQHVPAFVKLGKLAIKFEEFLLIDALGNEIPLSQKERLILELLYRHKNSVIHRDYIIEKIWGEDKYPSQRTVDNYIVKLRKWSETDPNLPVTIISIRGGGYKLKIV